MATRKGSSRKAAAKPQKPAAKASKAAKKKPAKAKAPPAKAAPRRGAPRPRKATGEAPPPEAPEVAARPPEEPAQPEAQDKDEEEESPEAQPEEEEDQGTGEVVQFEGVLTPNQPAGTFIPLTREQSERFPGAGIVRVKGTVGGVAIQSSLMPVGDGTRCLGVHKATMEQGGFHHGDKVKVAIRLDTAPREVVVPKDFLEALEKSPAARRTFANYAYTHRKEYVNWIEEAKQPETRQRRIDQAVRMIEANEKLS